MQLNRKLVATTMFLVGICASNLPAQAWSFGGHECSDHCQVHVEGYTWAKEHYITDAYQCTGHSDSFDEGCATYVADPHRDITTDDEGQAIE